MTKSQHFKLAHLAFVSIEGVYWRSHVAKRSMWVWPKVTSLDTRGVGLVLNWNSYFIC